MGPSVRKRIPPDLPPRPVANPFLQKGSGSASPNSSPGTSTSTSAAPSGESTSRYANSRSASLDRVVSGRGGRGDGEGSADALFRRRTGPLPGRPAYGRQDDATPIRAYVHFSEVRRLKEAVLEAGELTAREDKPPGQVKGPGRGALVRTSADGLTQLRAEHRYASLDRP